MKLVWDAVGTRTYETGVNQCVLYPMDSNGTYPTGVAWSGITGVSESPSGAEANPQYADNIQYLNLISAEEFAATITAFTYPPEWAACDGSAEITTGVMLGQQTRQTFGLCYRTALGNDVIGDTYGYKLHMIYGGTASPSEKGYNTINDSPEAIEFSWEVSTVPVSVENFKPTACVTIDSTKADPTRLAALEVILYGSEDTDARLPLPNEIATLMAPTP